MCNYKVTIYFLIIITIACNKKKSENKNYFIEFMTLNFLRVKFFEALGMQGDLALFAVVK